MQNVWFDSLRRFNFEFSFEEGAAVSVFAAQKPQNIMGNHNAIRFGSNKWMDSKKMMTMHICGQ